jgi:hypothetical protein
VPALTSFKPAKFTPRKKTKTTPKRSSSSRGSSSTKFTDTTKTEIKYIKPDGTAVFGSVTDKVKVPQGSTTPKGSNTQGRSLNSFTPVKGPSPEEVRLEEISQKQATKSGRSINEVRQEVFGFAGRTLETQFRSSKLRAKQSLFQQLRNTQTRLKQNKNITLSNEKIKARNKKIIFQNTTSRLGIEGYAPPLLTPGKTGFSPPLTNLKVPLTNKYKSSLVRVKPIDQVKSVPIPLQLLKTSKFQREVAEYGLEMASVPIRLVGKLQSSERKKGVSVLEPLKTKFPFFKKYSDEVDKQFKVSGPIYLDPDIIGGASMVGISAAIAVAPTLTVAALGVGSVFKIKEFLTTGSPRAFTEAVFLGLPLAATVSPKISYSKTLIDIQGKPFSGKVAGIKVEAFTPSKTQTVRTLGLDFKTRGVGITFGTKRNSVKTGDLPQDFSFLNTKAFEKASTSKGLISRFELTSSERTRMNLLISELRTKTSVKGLTPDEFIANVDNIPKGKRKAFSKEVATLTKDIQGEPFGSIVDALRLPDKFKKTTIGDVDIVSPLGRSQVIEAFKLSQKRFKKAGLNFEIDEPKLALKFQGEKTIEVKTPNDLILGDTDVAPPARFGFKFDDFRAGQVTGGPSLGSGVKGPKLGEQFARKISSLLDIRGADSKAPAEFSEAGAFLPPGKRTKDIADLIRISEGIADLRGGRGKGKGLKLLETFDPAQQKFIKAQIESRSSYKVPLDIVSPTKAKTFKTPSLKLTKVSPSLSPIRSPNLKNVLSSSPIRSPNLKNVLSSSPSRSPSRSLSPSPSPSPSLSPFLSPSHSPSPRRSPSPSPSPSLSPFLSPSPSPSPRRSPSPSPFLSPSPSPSPRRSPSPSPSPKPIKELVLRIIIPNFKFKFKETKTKSNKRLARVTKYNPSVLGVDKAIKRKNKGIITGLEIRGII